MVVSDELRELGLDVRSINLGEAIIAGDLSRTVLEKVKNALERNGFELIEDKRIKTIEQIKLAVLNLVRSESLETDMGEKNSASIARQVGQEYSGLSTLFSSLEGVTIEQYIILQKIERVKELLMYGELTSSEISYKLKYSSVQHLSNQFKKVTGLTPTQFKRMVVNKRKPLDKVVSGPS
jgi:AraC family transcriptional regulator